MNIIRKVAVIGGDKRSLYCAEAFAASGFECAVFGFEKEPLHFAVRAASLEDALRDSTAVILPLPITDVKNGNLFAPHSDQAVSLAQLCGQIPRDAVVLAGNPTEAEQKALAGYTVENYAKNEYFMLRGRVPTAEGALQIAMEQTDETIFGSKALVCGGGRIGRYLAAMLSALGADVTVSVRKKEDGILLRQHGFSVIHTNEIADCPTAFDLIFNTIPSRILEKRVLKKLRGSPLIIELASKPYGAGFTVRKKDENFSFRVRLTFSLRLAIIKAYPAVIGSISKGEYIHERIDF